MMWQGKVKGNWVLKPKLGNWVLNNNPDQKKVLNKDEYKP